MKIRAEVSGSDIVYAVLILIAAYKYSALWILMLLPLIASFFIKIRWSKTNGWRFWHD